MAWSDVTKCPKCGNEKLMRHTAGNLKSGQGMSDPHESIEVNSCLQCGWDDIDEAWQAVRDGR